MKYLITGITGTLGSAITPMLLAVGHEVVGFSRCELKQKQIPKHDNLTLYLGDVRDRDRLIEATRGVDCILHFASLKHVDTLELNPEEAIKTIVLGTENVLHAQRVNKIERVVFTSTDKAVYPINAYGYSKALGEKLVLRNHRNVVCRYGNVLGSRGSVLPMFIEDLKSRSGLNLTDRKMTRFWIPIEQAADFVWRSSRRPVGGLCIPPMKAYPVIQLGKLIGEIINQPCKQVWEIGIRPGEKIHEHLRTEDEGGVITSSDQSLWFSKEELKEMLVPIIETIK